MLDWEKYEKNDNIEYDYILAADVLYDVTVIPMLVSVVKMLKNDNTKIIFSVTKRNEKTFQYFLENCEKLGFKFNNSTKSFKTVDLFVYDKLNVELYEIY
jgi:2-polyprenyl-3-methyl-5-hydroxy-6-metoxy-1,4-benzoquinol methylase